MKQTNATIYDAIVVGLGPGGSTVSAALADAGLSVLALDQARFPRYKPCGGCLSAKIDGILNHDFHSVVERVIHGVSIKLGDGNTVHVRSKDPVAYMVMRDRFDDFLLQKAKKRGVQAKEGERVKDIVEDEEGVRVETAQSTYRGRFLVGADGVNGLVRRKLSFGKLPLKATLIEGEVQGQEVTLHGLHDEALLEFGHVPYGYGWIFPKSDHLSIGVGGIGPTAKRVKQVYRTFVERYDILGKGEDKRPYGYVLPIWIKKQRLTTERTILIGDAAGLVDPFIGEGIYYAIRSGQFAAQTILSRLSGQNPDLSLYQQQIAQEIYPEFSAARRLSLFVNLFPKLFQIGVKRNHRLFEHYFDVLRGASTYKDFWVLGKAELKADLSKILSWQHKQRRAKTKSLAVDLKRRDASQLWNTFLGKGAWVHIEALLPDLVKPGGFFLCTGDVETAEGVLEKYQPLRIIRIEALETETDTILPYEDKAFDLVLSAWTLEQLAEPKKAVSEFLRVLKDDGVLISLFSNLSEKGLTNRLGALIQRAGAKSGETHFTKKEETPYHNCPRSSIAHFLNGLITVTVLRKCCAVGEAVIPSLKGKKSED